jgi:AcrR family transcriptional regulator
MNRRSQRTRAALRSAFTALVLSRGYEAVAVRDIVRRAGVGRSTFYLHYSSKESLLSDGLEQPCRGLAACAATESKPAALVPLLEHFRAQRRLNRVFFEPPIRALWAKALALAIERQLARNKPPWPQPSGPLLHLFCLTVAEMHISLVTHWLTSSMSAKAEVIAARLAVYTQALLQSERSLTLRR